MEFVSDDVALSRLRRFPSLPSSTAICSMGRSMLACRPRSPQTARRASSEARPREGRYGSALPALAKGRWATRHARHGLTNARRTAHRCATHVLQRPRHGGARFVTAACDGSLDRLDIDRLVSGRNDASATIAKLADGPWDITVSGESIDLQTLVSSGGEGMRGGGSYSVAPRLAFAADVNAVWLGGRRRSATSWRHWSIMAASGADAGAPVRWQHRRAVGRSR